MRGAAHPVPRWDCSRESALFGKLGKTARPLPSPRVGDFAGCCAPVPRWDCNGASALFGKLGKTALPLPPRGWGFCGVLRTPYPAGIAVGRLRFRKARQNCPPPAPPRVGFLRGAAHPVPRWDCSGASAFSESSAKLAAPLPERVYFCGRASYFHDITAQSESAACRLRAGFPL